MQSVSFKVFPCHYQPIPVILISFLVICLEMDRMPGHLRAGAGRLLSFPVGSNRLRGEEGALFPSSASNLTTCGPRTALLPGVPWGCSGSRRVWPAQEPGVGALRLPFWERGAFSALRQSGVSCAAACLLGVWFHFECSLH